MSCSSKVLDNDKGEGTNIGPVSEASQTCAPHIATSTDEIVAPVIKEGESMTVTIPTEDQTAMVPFIKEEESMTIPIPTEDQTAPVPSIKEKEEGSMNVAIPTEDQTAPVPSIQGEDIMNAATPTEDQTAPVPSTKEEESINVAIPGKDQTAEVPFIQGAEGNNVAAPSEEQTAVVPSIQEEESIDVPVPTGYQTMVVLFHQPSLLDTVVPNTNTSGTSMLTELPVNHEFFSMNGSDHAAPLEVLQIIWKYALTANEERFVFTDQTQPFTPNVATSLLRVSRAMHHEVRNYLFNQNTFIFSRCGSDVRFILPLRDTVHSKEVVPSFKKVIFDFGDNHSTKLARFKTESFMGALRGLRHEVRVQHLTLFLGHDCFDLTATPQDFANALKIIKVTKSLEIQGVAAHLLHDIRAIPRAMGMNIQPVWSKLVPCDVGLDQRAMFTSTYVPAKTREETELQAGQTLMDAGVEYYARLMSPGAQEG